MMKISQLSILFFCSILILITSCFQLSKQVQNQNANDWRRLKCGLYLSPQGVLGFASDPEIANFPKSKLASEQCQNVFITHIGTDNKVKLIDKIDTNTFESLGASYYKDKSTIYNYYAMCEGGYLNIFTNDTATFKVLGSHYAVYQSKIYHHRNGLIDADVSSFKTSKEMGQLAKDKNGFFAFGERISEEELRMEIGNERVEELKKM